MKKLTKAQKARNRAKYNYIKRAWERTDKSITYVQFKNRVLLRAEAKGISYKEATKKEMNTETFVSAGQRSRHNLIQAIKEKHDVEYKELRNLARDRGRYINIEDNLDWDEDYGQYVLRAGSKNYLIDVTNSPEDVYIREI